MVPAFILMMLWSRPTCTDVNCNYEHALELIPPEFVLVLVLWGNFHQSRGSTAASITGTLIRIQFSLSEIQKAEYLLQPNVHAGYESHHLGYVNAQTTRLALHAGMKCSAILA